MQKLVKIFILFLHGLLLLIAAATLAVVAQTLWNFWRFQNSANIHIQVNATSSSPFFIFLAQIPLLLVGLSISLSVVKSVFGLWRKRKLTPTTKLPPEPYTTPEIWKHLGATFGARFLQLWLFPLTIPFQMLLIQNANDVKRLFVSFLFLPLFIALVIHDILFHFALLFLNLPNRRKQFQMSQNLVQKLGWVQMIQNVG